MNSCHLQRHGWIETVIWTEVSQKEKQILYINTYMWNLEKWYRWLTYLQSKNRHRHREQLYGYQEEKEGRDELRYWNWHTDLLILCVKWTTTENLVSTPGNSAQGSVVTWMRRKSEREGAYVYIQLIHFIVQQELTQHCKASIFQ